MTRVVDFPGVFSVLLMFSTLIVEQDWRPTPCVSQRARLARTAAFYTIQREHWERHRRLVDPRDLYNNVLQIGPPGRVVLHTFRSTNVSLPLLNGAS